MNNRKGIEQATTSHRTHSFGWGRVILFVMSVAILLLVGAGAWLLGRHTTVNLANDQAANSASTKNSVGGTPTGQLTNVATLQVNGRLQANNGLVLSPTTRPAHPVVGQIYYDQSSNQLYYFNGATFVSMASTPTPIATTQDAGGVTSLGGTSGAIMLGGQLQLAGNQLQLSDTATSLLGKVATMGTIQLASGASQSTIYLLPAVSGSVVQLCTSDGNCMPNGTEVGDTLVWNGSQWVLLPPGTNGEVLMECNGMVAWEPWTCDAGTGVTTTAASDVTYKSAVVGGGITGTAPDGRGIVYDTSINPSLGSSNTVAVGSGSGSFTATLQGLAGNVTYYARAYAVNGSTVTYGPQIMFTTASLPAYTIGEKGPAGGIVFYDKGSYSDGWRYLSAAPDDVDDGGTRYEWGCNGTATGAISTTIGTGEANTQKILAACNAVDSAAYVAAHYSLNGFTDWFLPSEDELAEMYNQSNVIGGFAHNWYWSSSESDSQDAWSQGLYYGSQGTSDKATTLNVRPIREF